MDRSETFTFRPLARTVVMLGEQLISDEIVAVTELVKNCYDADSSEVQIALDRSLSKLTITDKGAGMSEDDILYKWLVPATASKGNDETGKKRRTKIGRVPIGGKGIGRFATHHLGHELELITKTAVQPKEYVLKVNWDDYEKPDLYLDEVPNQFTRRTPTLIQAESGTVLRILRLKTKWDQAAIDRLADALGKLFNTVGFTITLSVDDKNIALPQGRGRYISTLADIRPEWVLTGSVDGQGSFVGVLNGVTLTSRLLQDRPPIDGSGETAGPFDVSMYVIEQATANRVKADERAAKIAKLQNEISGVLIYRDVCRVYPYGNPGVDWLGLERRRISELGTRISSKQLVAFVDITADANPGLVDKTNREGFLENQAFLAVRQMLLNLIVEIENARVQKKIAERHKSQKAPFTQLFKDLTPAIPAQAKSQFAELQKAVNEEIRHKDDRVKVMAELSGIGLAAEKATHEINHWFSVLRDTETQLQQLLDAIMQTLDKLGRDLGDNPLITLLRQQGSDMTKTLTEMGTVTDQLDKEITGLKPLYKAARGSKKDVDVALVVRRALTWFQNAIAESDIEAQVVTVQPLHVHMNEGMLLQVFMNLLDNAAHWLALGAKPRKLRVTVDGSLNCVYVSDNGPGITSGEEEIIFEPLISRKEDGRGLGLYIVRELLEKQGHKIALSPDIERSFKHGAEFKITFALDSRLGGQ